MKNITSRRKKIGIVSAFLTMTLQGFEGIFVALIGLVFISSISENPSFSGATLLGKEIFGVILTFLIFGPKVYKNVLKKIKSKAGLYYFLSGSIGTTLGNALYILAVNVGGTGYGIILTGLYPIFSLLLIKFVLKKQTNKMVWVGVTISIIGSILFILLPSLISGSGVGPSQIVGMIIGGLAALFWAIEGIFISKASKLKENNFNDKEKIVARTSSSLISTLIFIMPFTYIWGNSFYYFSELLIHWESLLILIAFALNVIILRYVFNISIEYAGLHNSAVIDSNNFLITPLLSIFLAYSTQLVNPDGMPLFEPIIWWSWLLIIPIIIGTSIVLKYNDNKELEKNIENFTTN
ncbi:MAG: EamA family transporter [Mycoplasmatales bacterium]|nr:EamA family transporter [Mycoplasmatales bacterium]